MHSACLSIPPIRGTVKQQEIAADAAKVCDLDSGSELDRATAYNVEAAVQQKQSCLAGNLRSGDEFTTSSWARAGGRASNATFPLSCILLS